MCVCEQFIYTAGMGRGRSDVCVGAGRCVYRGVGVSMSLSVNVREVCDSVNGCMCMYNMWIYYMM